MKVKALRHGQHAGRLYEPGESFEIDDKPHPIYKVNSYGNVEKDAEGQPIVEGTHGPLADWMQEIKDEPRPEPKEVSSQRLKPLPKETPKPKTVRGGFFK